MTSAYKLRNQIEASLANKTPGALSPAPRVLRSVTPTGIQALDSLLEGGLPSAAMIELVGLSCSGRTTTALAYVSSFTRSGSVCAWIDTADSLDPESVAANGVDLEHLLWVRCGPAQQASQPHVTSQSGVSLSEVSEAPRHTGGGSPHPRSEGRDMPQAIAAMLHAHGGLYDRQTRRENKVVGTPGAPNRPLAHRSGQREEQVNSDRLPPRRGDNLAIAPRCSDPQPRRVVSAPSEERMSVNLATKSIGVTVNKPWQAVDQALKATDLILQTGGFSTIVLDLGSIPPEIAWRIPLSTWFRFRAACERTRVSLLLLTQHPCARSSAELVVRLEPGSMEAENTVMTGIRYRATTERDHSQPDRVVPIRKPPQSERPGEWKSEAAWARMK